MTAKEQQQLGKLEGQIEMVLQSLTSLHDKVEAFRDRCEPCKKDILLTAEKIAKNISKDTLKSVKIWVISGVAFVLCTVCGYLFINHFMPNVLNTNITVEKKFNE
jgi:uncharacterized protein with PIN domain